MSTCAVLFGLNDRGISGAVCRALLARGVTVIAVSRNASSTSLADHPQVITVDIDFEDSDWCMHAMAPLEKENLRVGYFVHCAAANFTKVKIGEANMKTVGREFQVGLFSAMEFLIRADARIADGARVILFSSNAAVRGTRRRGFHYSSMKAALNGFVVGTAAEYAGRGIAINAIAPSQTLTERVFNHGRISRGEIEKRMKSYSPFKRAANPDEVAAFTIDLLFTKSPYLTGQIIAFDGGTALNWEEKT